MLKILSLKKEQAEKSASSDAKKVTAAQLRAQKDISELEIPPTMDVTFPDKNDIMHFNITITPDEGIYKNGHFRFSASINDNFPHEPPKVKCLQKIYHPNIDLEGNVCLNILREDWRPVLNINSVLIGLQYLFLEPNSNDPLNKDAAEDLHRNKEHFRRNVERAMNGGVVGSERYDYVMK